MSLPARMSGVHLARHGGPDALIWRDALPVPFPGPGEVLVRVLAAGVNMTEVNTRLGWHAKGEGQAGRAGEMAFPRIQISVFCGSVVALGAGVNGPPIGARVICPTNRHEPSKANPITFVSIGAEIDSGFAQYWLVRARLLHDVTASPLTDVEIGAMPCTLGTAHNLLTRAGVEVRDRVLVTGQCSAARAATVRNFGASFLERREALKPGGRCAASGAVVGPLVRGDLRTIYLDDLTLNGATHPPHEDFAGLVTLINNGAIHPVVSQTHKMQDISRAQSDLIAGRFPGKLVLIPKETHP